MRGDSIKSLLYMPGGHSMTINFPINMLGGPTKFQSTCLVDIVSMKLLDLALTWQLWLDGSGLVALALGATRTGLHLI